MRWPAVRRAATAGVGLLLLAACSPGDEPNAQPRGATVPTAAPTTTTTNPYAVPPVIDAAYVNRVLAGLDAVFGDVLRTVIASRTIDSAAFERLKGLYADTAQFNIALAIIQDEGRRDFASYLPNPGENRTTVAELITVASSCVFMRVDRDSSAVAKQENPRFRNQWIALKRLDSPSLHNPTGWAYLYEGFDRNLQAPAKNPCMSV